MPHVVLCNNLLVTCHALAWTVGQLFKVWRLDISGFANPDESVMFRREAKSPLDINGIVIWTIAIVRPRRSLMIVDRSCMNLSNSLFHILPHLSHCNTGACCKWVDGEVADV